MGSVIIHISEENKVTNPKAWENFRKELTPGKWLIEAKDASKRTLAQNAWFHAICGDVAKGLRDVGYTEVKTTDDAKAVIKALFFKKSITNGSETIEVIEGTSAQTKMNFAEKADEIINWAAQYLSINISPPSSQTDLSFSEDWNNQPGQKQ